MATRTTQPEATWNISSAVTLPYIPENGVVTVTISGYEMEIRTTDSEMVSLEIPYSNFYDGDNVVEESWYSSYGGENYHPIAEYHINSGTIMCNHLEVPEPLRSNGIGQAALSLIPEIADVYPAQITGFTIRFGDGNRYCSWLTRIGFPEEYVQTAPSRVNDVPSATVGRIQTTTPSIVDGGDVSLNSIGFEHFPNLG